MSSNQTITDFFALLFANSESTKFYCFTAFRKRAVYGTGVWSPAENRLWFVLRLETPNFL